MSDPIKEQSPTDVFNTGVTAAQEGQWGVALAYFEQAERLGVKHPKLSTYQHSALEKFNSVGTQNHSLWWGTVVPVSKFMGPSLTFALLGGACLFSSTLIIRLMKVKIRSAGQVLFTTGIALFLILVTGTFVFASLRQEGRVRSKIASLRSGPDKSFAEISQLPAGTQLHLSGEVRGQWTQVEVSPALGQSFLGWIANEDAFLEESL